MSKRVIKEYIINCSMIVTLLVLFIISLVSNSSVKKEEVKDNDLKEQVIQYLLDNQYIKDEDGCYKRKIYFDKNLIPHCQAEGGSCENFKVDSLDELYDRICIEKGFYEVKTVLKFSINHPIKYAYVPQYLQHRFYYKNKVSIAVLQGDFREANDSEESYHISACKMGENLYAENYKQKYVTADYLSDLYYYQSTDNGFDINFYDSEYYYLLDKLKEDLNVDWSVLSEWIK